MLPALIRMKTKFFYNKSHHKNMKKKSKTIRVMKLTCILFFMSVSMLWAAGSYAQSTTLSIKVTDKSITEVLEAIENQTEFKFFYNSKLVNTNRKVSIDVNNKNVFDILDQLFKNSRTSYKVVDKDVILTVAADIKTITEEDIVKGVVLDLNGYPVIGANVVEKGTTNGTVTDASGKFSLNVPANATLIVSYIGYILTEIPVNGKTSLSITLKEDQELLDEVVVVGYGVTKKRDLAGAITSLKTDDIKAGIVTNTAQFLKGRAAGVQVRQNSSEPGGGMSIRIRGASSISSNNEPLYVIDGFQTEIGNQINPEDIASIEILKDAAATAIYGARGANGVVLITTKKGSKDHFEVNYSYNASVKKLRNPWDLMDAQATISNGMKVWEENGSTGNPPYTAEQQNYKGSGIDWIDETTRTAMTQTHQFSIIGGGEKLSMAISGNYMDDLGVLVNTNFNRFSSRVNLEYKLTHQIRFGSNLYMARSKKNYLNMGTSTTTDNVIYNIFMMSPLTTPTGEDVFGVKGKKPGILNELYDIDFDDVTNNVYTTIYGEVDILKSLTARVQYTYSNTNRKSQKYYPKTTNVGKANGSLATIQDWKTDQQQLDALLTWHQNFNKKHDVKILGGTTWTKKIEINDGLEGRGFSTDEFSFNNMGAASTINWIKSNREDNTTVSFFGRAEYVLNGKYILNASIRADGASNFGKGNKWGYFPSGSIAWQLGDEAFMEFTKPLFYDIKLRASYGVTGNDGIGSYLSQLKYAMTDVYLGGSSIVKGMYPSNPGNEDLKWESTSQLDLGIDFSLLDKRLEFNFDYYIKKTKDLLNPVSVSTSTGGFTSMMGNNGKIENKGFELFIKSNNITNPNFSWSTTLNISRNRNKVLELNKGEARYETVSPQGWYNWEEYSILKEGYAMSSLYGYVFDGIIQKGETYSAQPTAVPGDPKFKDLDGDGAITEKDRKVIGDGNPDVILGLGNNFAYKNFDFSFFLDASIGNDLLNLSRVVLEDSNRLIESMNRWTQGNPSNTIPRNSWKKDSGIKYGSYINSRFVEDASYLRLQNVELGYSLPMKKWSSVHKYVKNLRVFVGAQNLFTITKYSGFDPEVSVNGGNAVAQGLDFSSYPSYRMFNFGAKITF